MKILLSLQAQQELDDAISYYDLQQENFGNEFKILLSTPIDDISRIHPRVAEAIDLVRKGTVHIEPGYDGVFGKIKVG